MGLPAAGEALAASLPLPLGPAAALGFGIAVAVSRHTRWHCRWWCRVQTKQRGELMRGK